eukprot:Gregarina_sp_Poly_1__1571@NODE_139_length_13109_cov_53_487809_g124_i0_p10_GENE_NODE_139_length_13109_cov_53_487809_g124_i0NODE_139_length_13109_cov_53_487809_g124_i0_p10_ORF_typecomplete_len229_score20_69Thioredoxin_8/PF13905_6/1_3e04Thioredoxin_8/PF13905_6/6e17AhpCTSA/PF00578_21/0_001Redoxin/PF08534_10/0_0026UCH_C/PF18031_1/0_11_NODE_139_length_13109_cov_53_487809_g124_i01239313079
MAPPEEFEAAPPHEERNNASIKPQPDGPGDWQGVNSGLPRAHGWNPHCPHIGSLYPAIYRPHHPHAFYHLHPLFRHGTLLNNDGKPVCWTDLRGVSVALYFGAGNIRRCRNFLPFLVHFYKTINENSDRQKVEVIYVPLDEDDREYDSHRKRMPWLALDRRDPLIPELKQHFGVFTAPERPKFGVGPRHQPPHMSVIGADGRTLRNLSFDHPDEHLLSRWNYEQNTFC